MIGKYNISVLNPITKFIYSKSFPMGLMEEIMATEKMAKLVQLGYIGGILLIVGFWFFF